MKRRKHLPGPELPTAGAEIQEKKEEREEREPGMGSARI